METEDLDKYLYGEDFKAAAPVVKEAELSTAVPVEEDEYEDEEDFEIVLDSSKASEINKRSLTSVSIAQDKNGNGEGKKEASSAPAPATSVAHFDPFAPANLAGKMLFDHDLDSIEDKPWRKPGADLTDYFNYGFTETTWRAYCIKQRALRDEFGTQKKISVAGERDRERREDQRGERPERLDRIERLERIERPERMERRDDYHHPRHPDSRPDSRPDVRPEIRHERSVYENRYNDPRGGQYDRHYQRPRSSRSPSNSPPPPPSNRRIVRPDDSRSPPPKRRRD